MCLHYLQKYRLSHFIIVLMSVYFYYMSDLFHLIYSHKNAVSLTFQASRVVIVVTLFIAYSAMLISTCTPWWRCPLSFRAKLNALDENLRQAVYFTLLIFISTFLIIVLRFSLCHGDGIKSLRAEYLFTVFTIISLVCCVSVFIAQRELRLKQEMLIRDLEQKRQFVRYMSHELR